MRRTGIAAWYTPLGDYLARQAAAGQRQVVLRFGEIEGAILGRPLPRLARHRPSWWGNKGAEFHAWHGWLRAGWFVGAVSLATETVTFTRGDAG